MSQELGRNFGEQGERLNSCAIITLLGGGQQKHVNRLFF